MLQQIEEYNGYKSVFGQEKYVKNKNKKHQR